MNYAQYLPGGPTDWVQFAVIALVIYWGLRLVRGTIAASIVRGAVAMIAISVVLTAFVLNLFDLRILSAILTALLNVVVFALVVVFQPELRRGLLSLGEHRFFNRFRAQPKSCVNDVARAIVNLSRERHGALFAIERRAALNHIVESGVRLDADARADLLANIFWPGAPLHDGGVVIRGNRIVAAACIFPLADRRDLTARMGTRHRAGLGLSEQSDAVIVIVSEETGRVSVAIDGELQLVDPPGRIGEVLGLLTTAQPEPEPEPDPEEEPEPEPKADSETDGADDSEPERESGEEAA